MKKNMYEGVKAKRKGFYRRREKDRGSRTVARGISLAIEYPSSKKGKNSLRSDVLDMDLLIEPYNLFPH